MREVLRRILHSQQQLPGYVLGQLHQLKVFDRWP
jgi:hypothetical protein